MRLEKTRQVKTCSKNDQMMIFRPCREPVREIFMPRAKKNDFFSISREICGREAELVLHPGGIILAIP